MTARGIRDGAWRVSHPELGVLILDWDSKCRGVVRSARLSCSQSSGPLRTSPTGQLRKHSKYNSNNQNKKLSSSNNGHSVLRTTRET